MDNQNLQKTEEKLELMKMQLYEKSRGLSLALGICKNRLTDRISTIGTDGYRIYVNPAWLDEMFASDQEKMMRLLMHTVCHCLLQHPFMKNDVDRASADQEAFELQQQILPFEPLPQAEDDHAPWDPAFGTAEYEVRASGDRGAGGKDGEDAQTERILSAAEEAKQLKRWETAKEMARRDTSGKPSRGSAKKSVTKSISLTGQRRYDYSKYLMQFATLREEGGADPEQFDYGLYHWSLETYGDTPILEPLEYRERQKIEELVIVIDTSASCDEEIVRMFLEETRNILTQQELFFRRFRLHLIQCDNQVQRDDLITSAEEFRDYLEHLTVTGGGGTDFRPAFARIEQLRREDLYRLKGVLYFTDGYGLYPEYMPDYQVSFVFLKYRYDDIDVPAWAGKLVLDTERPRVLQ